MSIAGPSHPSKPLPPASAAIASPYWRASARSNVDASVWADGNAVVPSARMPLGPSSLGSADGPPAAAIGAKSLSAIAIMSACVRAARSASARCG
jgi:hypothetical protein